MGALSMGTYAFVVLSLSFATSWAGPLLASATFVALGSLGILAVLALLVWWARNDPGKLGPLAPEAPSIQSEPEADPWEAEDLAEGLDDDETGTVSVEDRIGSCLAVLETGRPTPCRQAVAELVAMGPEVLPQLRQILEEADQDVRVDIAQAIEQIEAASS